MDNQAKRRLTENQKRRITCLRKQNVGYVLIAKELRLSVGAVKTFCRRNGLQSSDLAADTQSERITGTSQTDNLITTKNRGNTTTANRPESLENTGRFGKQPICEVTVSYADEPDETAVADVLNMLSNRR